MSTAPLHVCLDARLVSGEFGGVEQAIIGLAHGLSGLPGSADRYLFLVHRGQSAWLEPYLGGSCELLFTDKPTRSNLGRFLHKQRRRVEWHLGRRPSPLPLVPATELLPPEAAVERAGVDLMHFTMQIGFRTSIPSIYQPWDLQHLHLPEFFSPQAIENREFSYRALCDQAAMVPVTSSWIRRDLIEKYSLPGDKVRIVPLAPVIDAYRQPQAKDLARTRVSLHLPDRFILYPAKAWPHKNHIRLLEALRILRDQNGLIVPAVFTGAQKGLDGPVREAAAALGLSSQITFTGFIDPWQLGCLYRLAHMLVFPSLFEGWGMPVLEAFEAELPVVCSNVTCLPDLTAGAARLFDARDPADMAAAIGETWSSEPARAELRRRGSARAAMFSWDKTARLFRANYRRLANRQLTDEDVDLLTAKALV